jgi:hypothetical protein
MDPVQPQNSYAASCSSLFSLFFIKTAHDIVDFLHLKYALLSKIIYL